jgi:protein TonB
LQIEEIMPAVLPPEPAAPPVAAAPAPTPAAPTEAPPRIEDPPEYVASGPPGPPVPGALPIANGPPGAFTGIGTAVRVEPPPPPPQAEPLRRVGGNIREPKKVFDVQPVYPPIAIAARKAGTVILEAVIDESGAVARLRVLKSEPLLDEAALSAVRRWRYTPTLLNNAPIPILMTITVRFTLGQ